MMEPRARIPVMTVGGFLGAGKTTLVNHILRNADGQRILVFVNDFGAINIDLDLIETVEDDRISLTNGCVCCSLNDDFIRQVSTIARADDRPDSILVETSGVSDPVTLERSLTTLEEADLIRLDAKLYVVDAAGLGALAFDEIEAVIDHCAASDIVLLNKADLAPSGVLERHRALVAGSAPFAKIVETFHCDIAASVILGIAPQTRPARSRPSGDSQKSQSHIERYASVAFDAQNPGDRSAFQAFARHLAAVCLRAKGILTFADEPDRKSVV